MLKPHAPFLSAVLAFDGRTDVRGSYLTGFFHLSGPLIHIPLHVRSANIGDVANLDDLERTLVGPAIQRGLADAEKLWGLFRADEWSSVGHGVSCQ